MREAPCRVFDKSSPLRVQDWNPINKDDSNCLDRNLISYRLQYTVYELYCSVFFSSNFVGLFGGHWQKNISSTRALSSLPVALSAPSFDRVSFLKCCPLSYDTVCEYTYTLSVSSSLAFLKASISDDDINLHVSASFSPFLKASISLMTLFTLHDM